MTATAVGVPLSLVALAIAPLLASCSPGSATTQTSILPTEPGDEALPTTDVIDGWAACIARDRDRAASGDLTFTQILPAAPTRYPSFAAVHAEHDGSSIEYTTRLGRLTFTCWYESTSGTAQVGWNEE